MAQDYSTAAESFEENHSYGGPTGPHMDVFRVSAHAELGEREQAGSIVQSLVQSYPDFAVERRLARWFESTDDLQRILDNLHRQGLPR